MKKNFLIVSPGHDDYFESDRIIAQIPLCGGVKVPVNAINLKLPPLQELRIEESKQMKKFYLKQK